MIAPSPINLAVLVSGAGTTLQNFIELIEAGKMNARIRLVIASRSGQIGIRRAVAAGLDTCIIERQACSDHVQFSREVFQRIDRADVELVCLAGWLCLLELPERYVGKVINIHPALLPSFGGKGMFGRRVHEGILSHGCKVTGCTMHFVDSTYDTGPIILQRTCPVLENDSPESLSKRVSEEEKIAYPEAIRLFQQNRLRVEGRCVRVLPER